MGHMRSIMVVGSHAASPPLGLLAGIGATVGTMVGTLVGAIDANVGASVGSGTATVVDGVLFCMATMALYPLTMALIKNSPTTTTVMTLIQRRMVLNKRTPALNTQLHHNRPPIGAFGMLNDVFGVLVGDGRGVVLAG
jgi:hypothetical protein